METTPQSSGSAPYGFAARAQHSKTLVAIIAVLGVTVLALGAALVVNRSEAQPNLSQPVSPATMSAPAASTDAPSPPSASFAMAPVTAPPQSYANANRAAVVAPASTAVVPREVTASAQTPPTSMVATSAVCASCGTVETVTAIQRPGKVNGVAVGNTTIGLGAVAGGVLGGILGHQVGGGNGRTAMSVLGAAGGAYAGNSVEKNMNKVTVYAVGVRLDNGNFRQLEIPNSVPLGARVVVEGKHLRMANHRG